MCDSNQKCISTSLFCSCGERCLNPALCLLAKLNSTFLAVDYHWDEIKGGTFQCCFQLHPAYPTRTLCRGNNRSPPSVLSCSWATLAGLTQLAMLCFFSTDPKKTRERINQLTLSDDGSTMLLFRTSALVTGR